MVSLTAVEDIINGYIKDFPSAVTAIPDEKKGEQLVLVTEKNDINSKEMLNYFKEKLYSELWVPKKIVTVDKLPLLGTGKVDYVKVKEIAESK